MFLIKFLLLILVVYASPVWAINHSFTGLPITSGGWTDLSALVNSGSYATSRVVFVSNTGNDGTGAPGTIANLAFDTDGMFVATGEILPYATVSAGYAQIRNGYADILLLERGDEWITRFSSGGIGNWVKSGPSSVSPIIFSSYGSGNRPQITSDAIGTALYTYNVSNLLVSGIYFYLADWTTAKRCIDITGISDHITYEDCRIDGHHEQKIQGTGVTNTTIRRCVFYGNQAHDGQIYAEYAQGLLLEENVFSTPYDEGYVDGSLYGRHLYFSAGNCGNDCMSGVIIRGNIFYASDREGADIRCGGDVYNNLFVQGYLRVGDVGTGVRQVSSGNIFGNVLMEGSTHTGTATIILLLSNDGSKVHDNIITDPTNVTVNAIGISVVGNPSSTPANLCARNLDLYNNVVYQWKTVGGVGEGIKLDTGLTDVSNINIQNNQLQFAGIGTGELLGFATAMLSAGTFKGNKYYSSDAEANWFIQGNLASWTAASGETGATSTQIAYTAPTRTLRTYDTQLGGVGTTANFMANAILQSQQNWKEGLTAYAVINYIREGFDKRPVVSPLKKLFNKNNIDCSGQGLKLDITGNSLDLVVN